jgi:hypothetical protein
MFDTSMPIVDRPKYVSRISIKSGVRLKTSTNSHTKGRKNLHKEDGKVLITPPNVPKITPTITPIAESNMVIDAPFSRKIILLVVSIIGTAFSSITCLIQAAFYILSLIV